MSKYIVMFGVALALLLFPSLAAAAIVTEPPDGPPIVSLVEALGAGALAVLAWLGYLARKWLKWSAARELVGWAETRLSLAVTAARNAYEIEAEAAMADGVFSTEERTRARRRALSAFWDSVTPESLAGALKAIGIGDGGNASAETWANTAVEAALPPVGVRPSMPAPR